MPDRAAAGVSSTRKRQAEARAPLVAEELPAVRCSPRTKPRSARACLSARRPSRCAARKVREVLGGRVDVARGPDVEAHLPERRDAVFVRAYGSARRSTSGPVRARRSCASCRAASAPRGGRPPRRRGPPPRRPGGPRGRTRRCCRPCADPAPRRRRAATWAVCRSAGSARSHNGTVLPDVGRPDVWVRRWRRVMGAAPSGCRGAVVAEARTHGLVERELALLDDPRPPPSRSRS